MQAVKKEPIKTYLVLVYLQQGESWLIPELLYLVSWLWFYSKTWITNNSILSDSLYISMRPKKIHFIQISLHISCSWTNTIPKRYPSGSSVSVVKSAQPEIMEVYTRYTQTRCMRKIKVLTNYVLDNCFNCLVHIIYIKIHTHFFFSVCLHNTADPNLTLYCPIQ